MKSLLKGAATVGLFVLAGCGADQAGETVSENSTSTGQVPVQETAKDLGDGEPDAKAAPPAAAGNDELGSSMDLSVGEDSGIEGAPLPARAVPTGEGTWTVEGATYDQIVAFYEREMPEGRDWRGWAWCDTGGGEVIHSHIYAKPGRRIFGVTVVDDDQPAIIVSQDRSGPC